MTDFMALPQLTELVKNWQERICAVTAALALSNEAKSFGSDRGVLRGITTEMQLLVDAMQLACRLDVLEGAKEVVAERIDVLEATKEAIATRNNYNCRRYSIDHPAHPWTLDETEYYCEGAGFSVRRTVADSPYSAKLAKCVCPRHIYPPCGDCPGKSVL